MNNTFVISGCVKNCASYLHEVFKNIYTIKQKYNVLKIIIAYDNSNDTSLDILNEYKSKDDSIIILINDKPMTNIRTENISNARNQILDYVFNNYKENELDYLIMMDFDDVCSKSINMNVFQGAMNAKDDWDIVTFNNERYYDFWALSFLEYNFSAWHTTNPYKLISSMYHDFINEMKKDNSKKYIKCNSSFNGFGIFKYSSCIGFRYSSELDIKNINYKELKKMMNRLNINTRMMSKHDCEHRNYQMSIKREKNTKHVIWKEYLFPPYIGEHSAFLYSNN
jgi:hypothetical protein